MGAAAAVQMLDFLIGYGVKEVISAGTCGALAALEENEFLIPTEAHDDRNWGFASFATALKLCFDAVSEIKT